MKFVRRRVPRACDGACGLKLGNRVILGHSRRFPRCQSLPPAYRLFCPRMERPVKKLVKEIVRNLLSEARGGE